MSNIANKLRLIGYNKLALEFDALEKAWVDIDEIWNLVTYYGGIDKVLDIKGKSYINTLVRHVIFKNAPSKIHALIQMNIADSLLEKEMNMSVYSLFRFKRCLADYITDNMYIQNSKKGKICTNIKQCMENTGLGKLVVKQDKVGLYFYEKDKGLINKIDLPEDSRYRINVGVESTRKIQDNDRYNLELDKYIVSFKIYTCNSKRYELYHSSKYAFDIEDNDEEKEIANALNSLLDLTLKTNMKIHDAITKVIGEDLDKTVNNVRRILDE